jgi:hypothetical protein
LCSEREGTKRRARMEKHTIGKQLHEIPQAASVRLSRRPVILE